MNYILAALLLGTLWSPFGSALVVAFIAMHIFALPLIGPIDVYHLIVLSLFVSSALLASHIAGVLLDRFSNIKSTPLFSRGADVLALMLMFSSEHFIKFVEAMVVVTAHASLAQLLPVLVSLIGAILFCGGLTAFCLMVLVLLFEVPARWLFEGRGVCNVVPFAAIRPILIVFGLSLGLQLMAGLFRAELWPTTVVKAAFHS